MEDVLDIELKYTSLDPPICWQQVFGNTQPVEFEIGFGKCGFLLELAAQHPGRNIVGIESSRKYYRKGEKKIQRAGLTNIKLMWGEAFHVFKRYVPDRSLRTVYINFPDPWPKRRHAKRRLLKADFVTVLVQKLAPAGLVEIATDIEEYGEHIRELFLINQAYEHIACYSTNILHKSKRDYHSDYERMYLKEGRTIYYLTYRKK